MLTVLVVAALILGVLNLLALIWCVLSILEGRANEQILEYSVGLAFYNDAIQGTQNHELTPEEELNIVAMQQRLSQQAREIGLSFIPFQRPTGVDE